MEIPLEKRSLHEYDYWSFAVEEEESFVGLIERAWRIWIIVQMASDQIIVESNGDNWVRRGIIKRQASYRVIGLEEELGLTGELKEETGRGRKRKGNIVSKRFLRVKGIRKKFGLFQ